MPGLDLRGYELSERLGGGGMGDVYLAADPALGRDLAVKVMKADLQGYASAEQRFLREARITGSLQHPGIVPIYNLGRLVDGRLHYTMRLVRGRTFAEILREEAGQPRHLPSMLTIFERVCQAVAYAHSKQVIHRDLKPSNVMVGRFGEVQVMDWGLAKLLAAEAEPAAEKGPGNRSSTRIHTEVAATPLGLTQLGREMGTPAYMPPEQALGEWDTVDERADVFALGAILCKILTGQPPYGSKEGEEALRKAKRGDQAEALTRLEGSGADAALVALCRECLAPARENRPRDGDQVAHRVAAYQAEVQERLRQTELERTAAVVRAREERKRRRWMGVALVVVLAGVAGSTWQAVRATKAEGIATQNEDLALTAAEAERQAKTLAQTRLGQIEKANDLLTSIFRNLDPRSEENGGTSLRLQLSEHLERAAMQLDESSVGDPVTVARLQTELGTSLHHLGQDKLAVALLEKAMRTLESKVSPDHLDALSTRNSLAIAYLSAGRTDKAVRLHEQNLKLYEEKLGTDHPETLNASSNLAVAYTDQGSTVKAITLHELTVKRMEAKLGSDHSDTISARNNLAAAYAFARRTNDAIRLYEQNLHALEVKLGPEHIFTLTARVNLAWVYNATGRTAESIRLNEKNLPLMESKLGIDHPHTLNSRGALARAYNSVGRKPEAIHLYEKNLKLSEAKLGIDHPNTLNERNSLADGYRSLGRFTDAIRLFEQNLKQSETKLGPDHPDTLNYRNNLASAYWSAGNLNRSIPLFEETLRQQKEKLGSDHPKTLSTMANLGINYRDAGRLKEAIPQLETTLQRARQRSDDSPAQFAWVEGALAEAYEKTGEFAKAESLFRSSLDQTQRTFGSENPETARVQARLGNYLLKQRKYTDAEPPLRKCLTIREKKQPDDWTTFETRSMLGEALAGKKKYAEAEPLLLEGYEGMKQREKNIPPHYKARLAEGLERLVQLYDAWGKKDKANDYRKQLAAERAKPQPTKK